jgi:hypothetical protein
MFILSLLPAFGAAPKIVRTIDISPVWSGHTVGFAFLTQHNQQFVAFYDADRRLTVGSRALDSYQWQLVRLPASVVWDSHNYIAMAIDDDGYIHLSGNMHAVPLVYFRTSKPWDIATFEKIDRMTGQEEQKCTYPIFFRGPQNEFLFTYRDGSSGNGSQIYNRYDPRTRTWSRLLDHPLTTNLGHASAYLAGPSRGPDGYFHLVWVWRNTGDCSTNHDLSYARSKDLVHWETSTGQPLELPISMKTSGVVVDAVPVNGGIINGGEHLGWDSQKRPVITYHKYDEHGLTQAYAARLEAGQWKIYRITDWDYRWDFHGGGSIPFEVGVGAVRPDGKGGLLLDYSHSKKGSGIWRLDEATFKITGSVERTRNWPESLDRVESDFPGMQVRTLTSAAKGLLYVLRWETLGPNRDRPREGPLPAASMLRVYAVAR